MKLNRTCITLAAIGVSTTLLWGCENQSPEMGTDDVGQEVSDVVEEAREATSAAAQEAGEATEQAMDKARQAVEQAGDRIESATD